MFKDSIDEIIANLNNLSNHANTLNSNETILEMLGEYVLVRTYSAGVWSGYLNKKYKNEIILTNARRLWRWFANKSISLSDVANYGLKYSESRVCAPVEKIWMEAIEIIKLSPEIIKNIQECPEAEAN